MNRNDLVIILGCTATGKTKLSTTLAYDLDGEIISADSRQVFKDMDVGTGKDLSDFKIKGVEIPYHLINIKEAGEVYNVYDFQQDFLNAFKTIAEKNIHEKASSGGNAKEAKPATKLSFFEHMDLLGKELASKDAGDETSKKNEQKDVEVKMSGAENLAESKSESSSDKTEKKDEIEKPVIKWRE